MAHIIYYLFTDRELHWFPLCDHAYVIPTREWNVSPLEARLIGGLCHGNCHGTSLTEFYGVYSFTSFLCDANVKHRLDYLKRDEQNQLVYELEWSRDGNDKRYQRKMKRFAGDDDTRASLTVEFARKSGFLERRIGLERDIQSSYSASFPPSSLTASVPEQVHAVSKPGEESLMPCCQKVQHVYQLPHDAFPVAHRATAVTMLPASSGEEHPPLATGSSRISRKRLLSSTVAEDTTNYCSPLQNHSMNMVREDSASSSGDSTDWFQQDLEGFDQVDPHVFDE